MFINNCLWQVGCLLSIFAQNYCYAEVVKWCSRSLAYRTYKSATPVRTAGRAGNLAQYFSFSRLQKAFSQKPADCFVVMLLKRR